MKTITPATPRSGGDVGIKDVARAAGVSPATVSRVLGHGPVSEALRLRVHTAVQSLGYRPNLAARRLRSQRNGTIGLLVADIGNPFFTAVGRAVEESAYRAGLRVILCNAGENAEREAMYLQLMQEERITGLICAPTQASCAQIARQAFSFPMVLIDREPGGGRHDAVVLDNAAAMATLVDHLVERGHRRIAGLFGNASTTGVQRLEGYLQAMQRHGLAPQWRGVAPSAAAAIDVMAPWCMAAPRPTAVVASNGLLLMGALRAVRDAGLAIPRDMALAGFDNEPWTELVQPGLTVIEQPVDEIGHAAMRMLLERLATPASAVRKLVLAGRCVVRGSTAAPGG